MRKLTLTVTHRKDGRVCKRIDGQLVYWPDEETALAELQELRRRRMAGEHGRQPTALLTDAPLRTIGNLYRAAKRPTVKPETWDDYEEAIDDFFRRVGKFKIPSDLRPDDFAAVRAAWEREVGPWRIDNRVQAVRTMFRWAHRTARLIKSEPWYGDAFNKTTAGEKRQARREREARHGERIFTPDELRKILRAVREPLRTFTLLALNGGMYAADIAQIWKVDLKRVGTLWLIDNDREKTSVRRKCPLWPETVKAIDRTRDRTDNPLLFLTWHGNPWVRDGINSIVMLYTDFLGGLGIKRGGVNFGAFKHTHVSAVGDHPDHNAAKLVRGHKFSGIAQHYDFPSIKRLKSVTDLARKRLLTSVVQRRAAHPGSRARLQSRPSRRAVARSA
jgi:hypothetical protein